MSQLRRGLKRRWKSAAQVILGGSEIFFLEWVTVQRRDYFERLIEGGPSRRVLGKGVHHKGSGAFKVLEA